MRATTVWGVRSTSTTMRWTATSGVSSTKQKQGTDKKRTTSSNFPSMFVQKSVFLRNENSHHVALSMLMRKMLETMYSVL